MCFCNASWKKSEDYEQTARKNKKQTYSIIESRAQQLQANKDPPNCPVTTANITTTAYLGPVKQQTQCYSVTEQKQQPWRPFSSLPPLVSPALESFSNINVVPKALA